MSRIVAGVAGGRRLRVPAGRQTRPTGERVREALFSSLGDVVGALVLDLFAGTGALGLEALSRGAARVLLVESAPAALVALRANVELVALPGAVVVAAPVERTLRRAPAQRFGMAEADLVFCDAPYAQAVEPVLAGLVDGSWLAPGARVVVERSARGPAPQWPAGLVAERHHRYGETALWYGRRS